MLLLTKYLYSFSQDCENNVKNKSNKRRTTLIEKIRLRDYQHTVEDRFYELAETTKIVP